MKEYRTVALSGTLNGLNHLKAYGNVTLVCRATALETGYTYTSSFSMYFNMCRNGLILMHLLLCGSAHY